VGLKAQATPPDELSITFQALGDPTRRALLARLAESDATVGELASPFPISLQAVSKHLKVLEAAGLISRGRDAQFRPCRMEGEPLAVAGEWIESHRQLWVSRFDRLDEQVRRLRRTREEQQS
jgi:DNA-binding transcriptional ArsR family regulator